MSGPFKLKYENSTFPFRSPLKQAPHKGDKQQTGPDIVMRKNIRSAYFPAGHPDRAYINPTIELGPSPPGTQESVLTHEMEHYKQDMEGRLTTKPPGSKRPHFLSSSTAHRDYYDRKLTERNLAEETYFSNVPHRVDPIGVNIRSYRDKLRKKSLKGWVGKAEYTTPGTVEYEAVQAEKK